MLETSRSDNGRCNPLNNAASRVLAVFFRSNLEFSVIVCSHKRKAHLVVFSMFSFLPTFYSIPVCVGSMISFFFFPKYL